MSKMMTLLVVAVLALAGCGGSSTPISTSDTSLSTTTTSVPPTVPSTLPEIDEPYTDGYEATVNLSPEIPPTGPSLVLKLDGGETIIEGWFIPKGGDPIFGGLDQTRAESKMLRNSDSVDHLHDLFEKFDSEDFSSIDVVLTIEDSSGAIRTVSIDDARFEHLW